MVSASDVTFFKDNGYLIVRDFLSPDEITSLKSWAQEVHDYEATETSEFMPYEVTIDRKSTWIINWAVHLQACRR